MERWERHNREVEWLKDLKNELENDKHLQERLVISVERVTKPCSKMPYWKAPEKDDVRGEGPRSRLFD